MPLLSRAWKTGERAVSTMRCAGSSSPSTCASSPASIDPAQAQSGACCVTTPRAPACERESERCQCGRSLPTPLVSADLERHIRCLARLQQRGQVAPQRWRRHLRAAQRGSALLGRGPPLSTADAGERRARAHLYRGQLGQRDARGARERAARRHHQLDRVLDDDGVRHQVPAARVLQHAALDKLAVPVAVARVGVLRPRRDSVRARRRQPRAQRQARERAAGSRRAARACRAQDIFTAPWSRRRPLVRSRPWPVWSTRVKRWKARTTRPSVVFTTPCGASLSPGAPRAGAVRRARRLRSRLGYDQQPGTACTPLGRGRAAPMSATKSAA